MIHQRLRVCFGGVVAIILFLGARLFYIQILQNVNYTEIAEKQFKKKVKMESYRGGIVDRNGHVLAKSVESFSLFLQPSEFEKNRRSTLKNISSDLAQKIEEKMKSDQKKRDFVWLERKLSPPELQKFNLKKVRGLGTVQEQSRYFPNGSLASHLIGFVGTDQNGLSGIEQSFDSFLRGKQVLVEQLRDGKGRNLDSEEPLYSNSLTLSIDRTLQFVAEKELQQGVVGMQAARGMILIQNPKTGEILAMASFPNFDLNEVSNGKIQNGNDSSFYQNPMISHIFEPGSTFKIVTFSAALEEKKFSLTDPVYCEAGNWAYGNITIHDHEPSRQLTFEEVLEKSSNIGSAKISLKLDRETFFRYIRAFGFGTKTGIPLTGESEGLLRDVDHWSMASQPTLAFGQEVGVTAIQLVAAFSAIANHGLLMEPVLVKELSETKDGKTTVSKYQSQTVRRVISEESARKMTQMMTNVVEKGTGAQAKVPGFWVAGKTGTAQKIDPATRRYSSNRYLSSFCGFFPAENPQLVCLVLIDEPKKDYWGGTVAAPIFARVASRAVKILGIPPTRNAEIALAQK